MIHRSKSTVVIVTFLLACTALICAGRSTLITASSKVTSVKMTPVGPSQFYEQHNIVSDIMGLADHTDPNVVNAWGLDSLNTSPWWFSDNGAGKTTLFNIGTAATSFFTIPGAGGAQGNPTGLVSNGGSGFVVNNGGTGSPSAARFIFASEDGTLSAFRGNPIVTVVPNANAPAHGAVYKGLAIDSRTAGTLLYATDFHNAKVDVFNSSFHLVTLSGDFTDPNLLPGFAPFGIQNINGTLYVTYALQDEDAEDDVAGPGNGFVDAYDLSGHLLRRVASGGELNSPWGLALAPSTGFGRFSGDLLVGNFGNGRIHVFDPNSLTSDGEYEAIGLMHSAEGRPIQIDGLWALQFGHGANDNTANGSTTTLFFTAGPFDESHGLFGSITVTVPPGKQH